MDLEWTAIPLRILGEEVSANLGYAEFSDCQKTQANYFIEFLKVKHVGEESQYCCSSTLRFCVPDVDQPELIVAPGREIVTVLHEGGISAEGRIRLKPFLDSLLDFAFQLIL